MDDRCVLCGESMFIDETGVAFHGTPDEVDHDLDAAHVALSEREYADEVDALQAAVSS